MQKIKWKIATFREKYISGNNKKNFISKIYPTIKLILKNFILIFLFLIIYFIKGKNSKNINLMKNSNIEKEENNIYFACFCAMAKLENKYVRQIIEYYKNFGFDKFIFGDNNEPNTEKLYDVVQDYVEQGIVEIMDFVGAKLYLAEFYNKAYYKYNKTCEWISFFDFDEYLILLNNNKTINNIKTFLSNERYDKCESVSFNWIIYDDNDLVYYDNRKDLERFKRPLFNHSSNKFVKSIVRGNLNETIFIESHPNHIPGMEIILCSSNGEILKKYDPFSIYPPIYDYGYLIHFNTRTAEEFARKIKRGYSIHKFDEENRLRFFFRYNKFTEEKLRVFEKAFNKTFDKNDFMNINKYLR